MIDIFIEDLHRYHVPVRNSSQAHYCFICRRPVANICCKDFCHSNCFINGNYKGNGKGKKKDTQCRFEDLLIMNRNPMWISCAYGIQRRRYESVFSRKDVKLQARKCKSGILLIILIIHYLFSSVNCPLSSIHH